MAIKKQVVETIGERAVYLLVEWSLLGAWRGVETSETSEDVSARKRIIRSESSQKMVTLRNSVKALLNKYSHNAVFRPGVYTVPLEYIPTVEEKLKEALVTLEEIRQELREEWPTILADAKERLGKLFDASDYHSADSAARELNMTYRYMSISHTPDILKQVAAETYQADLNRSKSQIEAELEAFRSHLRSALLQLVKNMRRTLTKPDGEKRRFGKTFFKNLNEFMETFDARNLSEDGELSKVVSSLRKVAKGYDNSESLKSNPAMQDALNADLSSIDSSLQDMVEDGRKMDLSLVS